MTMNFQGERATTIAEGWEDGETDDEGEDVGWMWHTLDVGGYLELYRDLLDGWYYDEAYQRPYKGYTVGGHPPYVEESVDGARDATVQNTNRPDAEFVDAGWWKEYGPR